MSKRRPNRWMCASFFAVLVALLHCVAPPGAEAQTFVQLTDLGSSLGPRLTSTVTQQRIGRNLFGAVGSKVSFINAGTVYELASDPNWGRVVVGLHGQWVRQFNNAGGPAGTLQGPWGIDISGQRRVFIADRQRGRVLAATFDLGLGNLTQPMSWAGFLRRPVDVAWDGRNAPLTSTYVYVVDDSLHNVSYWDLTSGWPVSVWTYGGLGSGVGQFTGPSGICVGKTAAAGGGTQFTTSFYVVDRGNRRLVMLNRGTSSAAWSTTASMTGWDPTDCAVDHFGNVYVVDQSNHHIHKFTPYLSLLATYGTYGTGPSSMNTFAWPHAISVPCGTKVVNGQTVWYCEGRVVTAELWSDATGAVEHYLGMWGSIESPLVGDPQASVNFTATDNAYVRADVWGDGQGVVRTLVAGSLWPAGRFALYWDGRLADGNIAPSGYYHFRVGLSSAYTCPSGASWCWKTLYSASFWHRYCVPPSGGGGDTLFVMAAQVASRNEPPPRERPERRDNEERPPINRAQLPQPTCGDGGGGSFSVANNPLGVPQAFGVRQLPGVPVSVPEGLTALATVASVRPSLSITGAAVDAPADAVPLLRREVSERGMTALQVNLSEATDVRIEILDLAGRLVRRLAAGGQAPGMYVFRWRGDREDGSRAQPGVYVVVVNAQGRRSVSRMVLTAVRDE